MSLSLGQVSLFPGLFLLTQPLFLSRSPINAMLPSTGSSQLPALEAAPSPGSLPSVFSLTPGSSSGPWSPRSTVPLPVRIPRVPLEPAGLSFHGLSRRAEPQVWELGLPTCHGSADVNSSQQGISPWMAHQQLWPSVARTQFPPSSQSWPPPSSGLVVQGKAIILQLPRQEPGRNSPLSLAHTPISGLAPESLSHSWLGLPGDLVGPLPPFHPALHLPRCWQRLPKAPPWFHIFGGKTLLSLPASLPLPLLPFPPGLEFLSHASWLGLLLHPLLPLNVINLLS